MTDVQYWHRKTVDELFQARSDLHKVRTEFGRVSAALNEAVAEANRWQDAYEHAIDTPGPDTIRGWQHRIDQAEIRAQAAEQALADWQSGVGCCCGDSRDAEQRAEDTEQRVREHSEEIDRLVSRVVATQRRAELAEADRDHQQQRVAGWKDRAERVEVTNRGAMRDSIDAEARAEDAESALAEARSDQDAAWRPYVAALTERAEKAETDRDAWRLLANDAEDDAEELNRKLTDAEQRADIAEANATDYLDRATRAEEDRDRIEAQARGWKQTADQRLARGTVECCGCNEVELDRYATEQRSAMWWEAAKTLRRQLTDARCDRKLLQHLVDDAELARDAADAEVRRLAGADERAGCCWQDANTMWRRNRLALSVLAQRPYDHATAELAARVLDGTNDEVARIRRTEGDE